MPREIHVTIEKGKATVATQGFEGKACQDATAELESAMGTTTRDDTTPEWHQREQRVVGQ